MSLHNYPQILRRPHGRSQGEPRHHRPDLQRKLRGQCRKESTIWEFDKPKKNGDHPTMKPIPFLTYPIQNSSMANSVVLDHFGGSGSTLIACEQTDRICCTIELDEKFCDVIVRKYIE